MNTTLRNPFLGQVSSGKIQLYNESRKNRVELMLTNDTVSTGRQKFSEIAVGPIAYIEAARSVGTHHRLVPGVLFRSWATQTINYTNLKNKSFLTLTASISA